jgi:hypothetical protein
LTRNFIDAASSLLQHSRVLELRIAVREHWFLSHCTRN